VFPGAVDAHVHCFSELAEGFEHATAGAAVGGVTTIVEMPYDADNPVVDADQLHRKREALAGSAVVDVALLGTIRKVDGPREIPGMVEAGACGFKVSMFETHPARFPRISPTDLLEAFGLIAEAGLTVCVHAEDGEIIAAGVEEMKANGQTGARAHGLSRPPISETASVATVLELASVSGVQLHICHASQARVADLVSTYKEEGYPVSVETCPHYLVLSDDDVERLGPFSKINPPLRPAVEKELLWDRVRRGAIDMIASDHAPWLAEKKRAPVIFDNSSGTPGVEVLVPLVMHHGVISGRVTVLDVSRLLAEAPAERYGMSDRKGALRVGADADFMIWDPAGETTLSGPAMQAASQWTPYEGAVLRGRIEATFVRGKQVVSDGKLVASTGWGRFVAPSAVRQPALVDEATR
jgi:allantoinase